MIIDRLKQHVLVDGFHVIVDPEQSQESWIVEKGTGKRYLDCYSQFASQPFGWNYPPLVECADLFKPIVLHKLANSDMYSDTYADFVDAFASIAPDFKHFFFIDGGALAVENALKAAFDWKCQIDPWYQHNDGQDLDVIHLQEAFHGRSGYTMSLTNTGELKTKWYPKFKWTRVHNPKIHFPMNEEDVIRSEQESLNQMKTALERGNVAAIILETIQGEGGDNHFRPQFFQAVRELANTHEAMFILDEVQTGMGLTGKQWAYEHYGVKPDMIVFGKKTQVCGFCCNERIEQASNHVFKQSGRINSTWGGNIVDMFRCKLIIKIMKDCHLIERAAQTGNHFVAELKALKNTEISNIRGKGLMIALDLPTTERRDQIFTTLQADMLALKSGDRSIRFRPPLTFSEYDVRSAIGFLRKALS